MAIWSMVNGNSLWVTVFKQNRITEIQQKQILKFPKIRQF